MIEHFKPAPGGFRYVYVAINKLSKWIKYKLLVSATTKKAVELFEDIIHRFGLSNSITTFGTSAKTVASPSNMSPLLILEPTDRSNGRTT